LSRIEGRDARLPSGKESRKAIPPLSGLSGYPSVWHLRHTRFYEQ